MQPPLFFSYENISKKGKGFSPQPHIVAFPPNHALGFFLGNVACFWVLMTGLGGGMGRLIIDGKWGWGWELNFF